MLDSHVVNKRSSSQPELLDKVKPSDGLIFDGGILVNLLNYTYSNRNFT